MVKVFCEWNRSLWGPPSSLNWPSRLQTHPVVSLWDFCPFSFLVLVGQRFFFFFCYANMPNFIWDLANLPSWVSRYTLWTLFNYSIGTGLYSRFLQASTICSRFRYASSLSSISYSILYPFIQIICVWILWFAIQHIMVGWRGVLCPRLYHHDTQGEMCSTFVCVEFNET